MQAKLASIIKGEFKELPFINKLGGLVFTQNQVLTNTNVDNQERTETFTKRFPVTADVWLRNSNADISNKIIDFVPNSSNVGMIYFEPTSDIREVNQRGRFTQYSCGYRIVFWGNSNHISNQKDLSNDLVMQVKNKIKTLRGKNIDGFISINPRIAGISSDASIFSRYTYSEEVNQYLMPPFVYFAINIDVTFFSSNNCCVNVNPKISKC